MLLRTHIETSKLEVRKISLHQLYAARGQEEERINERWSERQAK
jgi:hypothetical protein